MSGALPPSSSGLGLRPFKAATGIRIPLGAQRGGVVKSGVHAGLSSRRSRVQIPSLPPSSNARVARPERFGQVAQLVEHRSEKPGVGGSIPPLTTTSNPLHRRGFASFPTCLDALERDGCARLGLLIAWPSGVESESRFDTWVSPGPYACGRWRLWSP